MKKFYKFVYVLIVPFALLLYSYNTGSPGGKTNSPGDDFNNCTECHTGNALQSQAGWITSNIPAEGYVAGQVYTITATGTDPAAVKMGFEITSEDSEHSKTGTFGILEPARTKFTNSNSAVTHTSGGIGASGGTNSWQMSWTAPSASTGQVTFYAAFNAANGNGNNSGDKIYASTYSVNPYVPNPQITSVDPNHGEQGWSGEITIVGSETTWLSGVFSVNFILHDDMMVSFSGTDINVISNTELTVNVDIPAEQTIGLYDVKVNALKLENAFTVDIASAVEEDLLSNAVQIYPNPSSAIVTLELPEKSSYKIMNVSGQILATHEETSVFEQIDISGYKTGIYFVQVIHGNNSVTKRIIKN